MLLCGRGSRASSRKKLGGKGRKINFGMGGTQRNSKASPKSEFDLIHPKSLAEFTK
jgi:hypothetical protein